MTEMVVSFYKLNDTGDDLYMVQFHGVPFVPTVGEKCCIVSSRDSEGNYPLDGKPGQRWSGTVVKREFSYEIQGRDSASYRSIVYVDVYIDCGQRPETTDE